LKSAQNSTTSVLRIFRREASVEVLGPGRRAVIWVQGCPFACKNCIVPESWDSEGGEPVAVEDLAAWALAQPDIEGVTFSGGEPMAQAEALATLVDRIRAQADFGVVCYTGYVYEHLLKHGTPGQKALLARTDLLIDGVYIEREHAALRWRGSANQRLLALTERYRAEIEKIAHGADQPAGMQFFMAPDGRIAYAGVPPKPGFREEFAARMANLGIALQSGKEG